MAQMKELFSRFSGRGKLELILLRPARRQLTIQVQEVEAVSGRGLAGDHYAGGSGSRQVTLIQREHLSAVGSYMGLGGPVGADLTRRNLITSGINLLALKGRQFKIGDVLLEFSGECHPCSRMEENLGTGGYNAMRGHGGITARIIQGGIIRVGDPIQPC